MAKVSKKPDLQGKRRGAPKPRVKGNKYTTKSGKTIKLSRTLSERSKARKEAKALRKSERQKGMPKGRIKRFFFRLHPKRLFKYWFSRDGLIMAMKLTGATIVVMFFALAGLFAYFRKDLPNLRDISGSNIGGSIRYYDRTGETLLWEDYDAIKRVPIPFADMSEHLIEATIAVEDRDFYDHSGFNVRGITRAAWNNAFGGDTQGGSTITQQLVKLTTPGFSTEQTIARKIKELILAVEIERSYSKTEILTGYLNAAPYGPIETGVEVAARTYFHKSASEVTIDEAAFLAAIPKSPPTYSPYGPGYDQAELLGRYQFILDTMLELHFITQAEYDSVKDVDVLAKVQERPPSLYTGIVAPYFVLAAKSQLQADLTEASYERGGWKVITTVDLDLQRIAEEEVASGMTQILRQDGNTAAFVAQEVETGQVVAMVGGADFNDKTRAGEFNFAQRPLPPGSSFKPYDYLALIEHTDTAGAGSVLYDTKGPLEGYLCTRPSLPRTHPNANCLYDYDSRFPGPVTLRYSLGGSRNVPAVKAMLAVGVDQTISTAEDLGLLDEERQIGGYKCYEPGDRTFTIEISCFGSSAIGDGAYLHLDKHVHAYSTISRNGNKIPQTFILKVEDSQGKTITEWEPSTGEQVVRADSAYITADMMSDRNASYMGRKMHDHNGWKFSLKTGTTNDNKDGWLMGFSTKYSAGVWVGHHTGEVEMAFPMETMTQPIWGGWMQRAHDFVVENRGVEPIARERPAGVQELPAYVVRNHVGLASREPSPAVDLFPSWYVKPGGNTSQENIVRDRVSKKRATECTPPLAREEVQESNAAQFSSDPFYDSATNSEDPDDVHKCEDVKPSVSIESFNNGGGEYTFQVSVGAGTHPIATTEFPGVLRVSIDGQTIPNGELQLGGPGVYQFEYTSPFDSTKTVTAYVADGVLYEAQSGLDVTFISADDEEETTYLPALREVARTREVHTAGSA